MQWHLLKPSKEDLTPGGAGYLYRYRDHGGEMFQSQKEIGLTSKSCMGKGDFTAKEQGG